MSCAGGELCKLWPLAETPRYDALVIDEAAQAVEPAALIPLQLLQVGAQVRGVGWGACACRSCIASRWGGGAVEPAGGCAHHLSLLWL